MPSKTTGKGVGGGGGGRGSSRLHANPYLQARADKRDKELRRHKRKFWKMQKHLQRNEEKELQDQQQQQTTDTTPDNKTSYASSPATAAAAAAVRFVANIDANGNKKKKNVILTPKKQKQKTKLRGSSQDREDREAEPNEIKLQRRARKTKRLTARTSRGQPVMKHVIKDLLGKVARRTEGAGPRNQTKRF